VKFSEYEQLRFERLDHGVLLITMDRPDKYNAADERMHGELARVWTEVSADPQTRVAVITGAGKAFSAGADLEMVRRNRRPHREARPPLPLRPAPVIRLRVRGTARRRVGDLGCFPG